MIPIGISWSSTMTSNRNCVDAKVLNTYCKLSSCLQHNSSGTRWFYLTHTHHSYQCRNGVQWLLKHIDVHNVQFKNITSLENRSHAALFVGYQNGGNVPLIQYKQSTCHGSGSRTINHILIQTQIQLTNRLLVNRRRLVKGRNNVMKDWTVGENTKDLVVLVINHDYHDYLYHRQSTNVVFSHDADDIHKLCRRITIQESSLILAL